MNVEENEASVRIVDQVVQPRMSNLLLNLRKAGPNAFLVVNHEAQRCHPECRQVLNALAIASSRKDSQTMAMEFPSQGISDSAW